MKENLYHTLGHFKYLIMTFGLPNVGLTFQREMDFSFKDIMGNIIKIHQNDPTIFSKERSVHVHHLRWVFERCKKYGISLIITLICTRHAYLASGHLRFLLFQNTVEQLFLKTLFIKAHVPCSITARVYMLADPKQPACTYKSMKKGKLSMEHTALGELTEPSSHAWPRVRPNT
jgi:hypothetical protein